MNRNTWYLSFIFAHFKLNSICLYDAGASIFVVPFSRHQPATIMGRRKQAGLLTKLNGLVRYMDRPAN
jgi:hypothetical protein